MGDLYDDKIETMLVTRQRMSEQKRIQRQKELQKQYGILAGALVALLIVIVIIVKGCSGEKDTKPKDKAAPATTEAQVTEELTTLPEETTIESTTAAEEATATVSDVMYTTDVLNFRTAPNTDADLIRHLEKGTEVKVISTSDGWCEIEYGDHIGYVSQEYLSATKPE